MLKMLKMIRKPKNLKRRKLQMKNERKRRKIFELVIKPI